MIKMSSQPYDIDKKKYLKMSITCFVIAFILDVLFSLKEGINIIQSLIFALVFTVVNIIVQMIIEKLSN